MQSMVDSFTSLLLATTKKVSRLFSKFLRYFRISAVDMFTRHCAVSKHLLSEINISPCIKLGLHGRETLFSTSNITITVVLEILLKL